MFFCLFLKLARALFIADKGYFETHKHNINNWFLACVFRPRIFFSIACWFLRSNRHYFPSAGFRIPASHTYDIRLVIVACLASVYRPIIVVGYNAL